MNKKCLILCGIPGIGKSTYVNSFTSIGYYNLERDKERLYFGNEFYPEHFENYNLETHNFHHDFYYKLDKQSIKKIESAITDKYYKDIASGKYPKIIISDTNLNQKHREALINHLEKNEYEVELKIFDADLMKAIQQNQNRLNKVPNHIIFDMWQKQITQFPESRYPISEKRKSIICDIDGTIAHNKSGRGWYEYDKVKFDEVDPIIKNIIESLSENYTIIFVSGRELTSYQDTVWWLYNNVKCKYGFDLYMRSLHDHRDDTIIKKEIYENIILKQYGEIVAVFDDRPKVCEMWLDLNLKVFTVSDYRIRF